jgi:hypothetical protein
MLWPEFEREFPGAQPVVCTAWDERDNEIATTWNVEWSGVLVLANDRPGVLADVAACLRG